MLWRLSLLAVATVACGRTSALLEDTLPRTCGGTDPVRLLSAPLLGRSTIVPTRVGDRFVVDGVTHGDEDAQWAYSVDRCGEDLVELVEPRPGRSESLGGAGPWMLAADVETSRVHWVDPFGHAPRHVVFEEAYGCLIDVADGLATQAANGDLWFHPDPSNADERPRLLAGGALAETTAIAHTGDFTACSPGTSRPILDGDGLLSAFPEGPLFRVDARSGVMETLAEGPVIELVAFDDLRFILWRVMPVDGCCDRRVLDRSTGVFTMEHFNLLLEDLAPDGSWATLRKIYFGPPGGVDSYTTTFKDLASDQTFHVSGWWEIEAAITPTIFFLRGGLGRAIVDTTTEVLTLVDFPTTERRAITHPHGVIALEPTNPFPDYGTLLLLPSGGGPIQVIAEDVNKRYWYSQTGTVVTFEDVVLEVSRASGTLVAIPPGGARLVIDEDVDVSSVFIPFYGTPEEHAEVLYVRDEDEQAELWRYAIP